MADTFSDARLEAILMSVGEHLVVSPVAPRKAAPSVSPWPRRLAVAAAVLVVALVATVAVAPAREAVARWLGIGSTRIERVPGGESAPDGLPTISSALAPASVDDAQEALGGALPVVDVLGPPEAVYVPPEGGVILAWPEGSTTLWIRDPDFEPAMFVKKLVDAGEPAESIAGVGDEALIVEGTHILETPHRRLAAGTVLLWVDGDNEYRLESDLDREAMLDIARSVAPRDGGDR
jgi:hypothetical protein